MKEFFYGIENLFVNYFFIPFDVLREVGDYNWWLANIMAWVFIAIGTAAFCYWMIQLKNLHYHQIFYLIFDQVILY